MITHTPGTRADPPCACPECDQPIPYKLTPTRALVRSHNRRITRTIYTAVALVFFGLGTAAGLVLQSCP